MVKARIINTQTGKDKEKQVGFEIECQGTPEHMILEAAAIVATIAEKLEPDNEKNRNLLLMAIIDQTIINLHAEKVETINALPLKKELDKLKEARGDNLGTN